MAKERGNTWNQQLNVCEVYYMNEVVKIRE